MVGGVLARAVQQSAGTIRLYAFTFASNHFVAAFREAAAQWMRGDFLAPFPLYSSPPSVVPSPPTRIL